MDAKERSFFSSARPRVFFRRRRCCGSKKKKKKKKKKNRYNNKAVVPFCVEHSKDTMIFDGDTKVPPPPPPFFPSFSSFVLVVCSRFYWSLSSRREPRSIKRKTNDFLA